MVNVLVGALGCLFAAAQIREMVTERPLPPVPAARASQSAPDAAAGQPAGQPVPIAAYQTIATKNLFNPGRSETTMATGATAVAPGSKPVLHGVLIDGNKSRAYLEETPAGRVFGYAIGDTVAGGRLDSIGPDRVVIARPEGRMEVLLQDPSKPKAVAPAAASPVGQQASPVGQRGRTGAGRLPSPGQPQPPSQAQPQ
jgi:Type II secretion system protein C